MILRLNLNPSQLKTTGKGFWLEMLQGFFVKECVQFSPYVKFSEKLLKEYLKRINIVLRASTFDHSE